MTERDVEFPVREDHPLAPEEFPQPRPEAEFRQPNGTAEDASPPGQDYVNPADEMEFSPPGSGRVDAAVPSGKRKRLRRLLYGVFALVLLGLIFFRPSDNSPSILVTPSQAVPAVSEAPVSPDEPTPELTPEPTAPLSTDLECHLVFFNFSAMHHGFIKLFNQQDVISARAEIWETNLESLEWSQDLSAEEIERGYFPLPGFDDSDTYFKFMDEYEQSGLMPALELRVTLCVDAEGESRTLSYSQEAIEEQGWSVSYWGSDFTPLWEGQSCYPDCFGVMSYEAYDAPPAMRMGSYQDALDSGAICIELTINGVPVPAEGARIITRENPIYRSNEQDELVETGKVYYTTTVVIPRPADAPAQGSAHFTIFQYLSEYDLVWVSNRDLEYGK